MANSVKIGAKAPNFSAVTHDGNPIHLGQFRGKCIWLIFYRYPECPLCNLHLSAVRRRYETYSKQGLEVVAVFESPPEAFPKNMGGKDYPLFPLIADPEKEIYKLYGAEVKLSGVFAPKVAVQFFKALASGFGQGKVKGELGQLPASFLISRQGIVEDYYYGRNIADHLPFEDVEDFLTQQNVGEWGTVAIL